MSDDRRERRKNKDKDKDDEPILIDRSMSEAQIELQIRKRVERRVKKRNEFFGHLVSFLAVNGLLWMIFLRDTSPGDHFPWPLIVTLFWGIGLASHAFSIFQDSARVQDRREAAIRREIEMEKARLGIASTAGEYDYEKPKRERMMRLTDDGELEPVEDDEDAPLYRTDRKDSRA